LATLLDLKGYKRFAKVIDRIASDNESLEFRAKQDNIKQIVLDNINVSPETAEILVKQIFEVLQSGVKYHRDWPHAYKLIIKSLVNDPDIKEPVPRIQQALLKLKPYWQRIQEIAYGTVNENSPLEQEDANTR